MKKEDLIGKSYELLDMEENLIHRIKINFVKEREIPSDNFDDGSYYAGGKQIVVSENGSGWYGIRNNKFERSCYYIQNHSINQRGEK